eukprot:1075575-Prorocentrum_minimum.AAC.3
MGTHQAVREGVAHYLLYEDPRWQGGAGRAVRVICARKVGRKVTLMMPTERNPNDSPAAR